VSLTALKIWAVSLVLAYYGIHLVLAWWKRRLARRIEEEKAIAQGLQASIDSYKASEIERQEIEERWRKKTRRPG